MSSTRLPGAHVLLVALALLAATPSAFAIKFAWTVGAVGPGGCDFSTIQAAVDFAKNNPPHSVYITGTTYSPPTTVLIDNQDVTIFGGFTSCSTLFDSGVYTTISGASNGGQSVITITGTSHVTLGHLTISDGPSPLNGGGINFLGAGSLDLGDVTVSNNTAINGGGIGVNGSSGTATLTLGSNVLVLANTASGNGVGGGGGGGIDLEGAAHLLMSGAGTQVSSNNGVYGGGISVTGPAQADIGAPGIGSHGAIYNNTGSIGAGIYAAGSAAGTATVTLFTTDSAHPVFLDSNSTTGYGGAIFLDASLGPAVACFFDMHISGNSAGDNSVVGNAGGQLYMNTNPGDVCSSAALAAAVRCTPGPGCNEISGNTDADLQFPNANAEGGLINVSDGGILQANRVIFRGGNTAAYAIKSVGSQSAPRVSDCLISGNHFMRGLIYVSNGDFTLDGCTTANNTVNFGTSFESAFGDPNNPNHFILTNSVIAESAGYKTFINDANGDGILQADYDLLSDTSTVSQGSHYFSADPQFVDPANGDYHLQPTSPAVDFAPAAGGVDLDGNPRDVVVYDDVTPRDIGAYEYQIGVPDRVFADGFDRQ
jgi:hypothetical protein